MKFRTTIALVVIALVAGVFVYINPFEKEEESQEKPPWFYQIALEDIEAIGVTHNEASVRFVKTPEKTWAFVEPEGIPPDHMRWGGLPFLLTGPQTRRDLLPSNATIDDPAEYGLDNPSAIIDVDLAFDRVLQFRLGDATTDGDHYYGQISGFSQLFLISALWGDVVTRLADEPPIPKWYVKRDPEEIVGVNVFLGDYFSEDTPALQFKREEGVWSVRDLAKYPELVPVDEERWAEVIPLLVGPPNISVAVPKVDDRDYTPWGIVDDSKAVELRFAGETERGTEYTDGLLFKIGSKTPDGSGYYARNESDYLREPVLFLDANWVDALFALYDDIPYGQQP